MIALWSQDTFDREAEPHRDATYASLSEGLAGLWRAVLREGILHDGRASFTRFSLEADARRVQVPVTPFDNPELVALRERVHEPGFLEALVAVHTRVLEQPFSFAPFLAIGPPEVLQRFCRVLAEPLGLRADSEAYEADEAGWRVGQGPGPHLAIRPAARAWVIVVHGLSVDGAVVPFAVTVRFDDEGGWKCEHTLDVPQTQPLRDALLAAGLISTLSPT